MRNNFSTKFHQTPTNGAPKRLLPAGFFAACAIALSLSATLVASPVQMTFVGVNGAQAFGYYIGPYSGTMNGGSVDLFCVDFANEVNFGQQWDANLTSITSDAGLGDTRYGTAPGGLELYQQAAWLTLQYASQPTSEYADIQATIWRLFSDVSPVPSSQFWLDQARGNYASADYADFRIVTNIGPVQQSGQVQEFLTQLDSGGVVSTEVLSSAVPEPSTELLVGLALVGLSCAARRSRRRAAAPRAK
jgi:hypothetical protein